MNSICRGSLLPAWQFKKSTSMNKYIHQLRDWPQFTWNNDDFFFTLAKARNIQGKLAGKMESLLSVHILI